MTTYYAQLDTNHIVTQVITGVDDRLIEDIPADEWYTNFCGVVCVETFMDAPNKTYAGIGYTYDAVLDEFVAPVAPVPVEPL